MVKVSSEISKLKKLIIHEPDMGIARITPKRAEELLFDDIVFFPKMKAEHKIYSNLLDLFLGKENVLRVNDLLVQALQSSNEGKAELLDKVIRYEEIPDSYLKTLENLNDLNLAEVLITGYLQKDDLIMFDPIPNFIFTRDIAVVVNEHVIITKASKEARFRENLLTRFIFSEHPMFKQLKDNGKLINLNLLEDFPPSKQGESVNVEGGDIMILNQDYLLVGSSERSNDYAFQSLKNYLFENEVIDHVVQVHIPADRSFMHIDTLFTQIDHDLFAAFKPIVHDGKSSYIVVHHKSGEKRVYPTLENFLKGEINPDMKFLWSGGGVSPDQEREQWTDACNLLTLKPGVAIAYDRNQVTASEFQKIGYSIIDAETFVRDNPNADLDSIERTIFTLQSAELSRARGGSHCMSCPILRS